MELPVRYYEIKYGNSIDQAFIHLIREIGQIAYALETKNQAVFSAKVTEATALLEFLAHKHNVNIESNIESMYSKKLAHINRKDTENRGDDGLSRLIVMRYWLFIFTYKLIL